MDRDIKIVLKKNSNEGSKVFSSLISCLSTLYSVTERYMVGT